MSTKTSTNTANSYNSNGMAAYNSLVPNFANTANSLMTNPLNNSMFSNQLAQSKSSASQVNQRNMANSSANLRAGGGLIGQAGGYQSASMNNAMLSGSTNSSNAFNSTLNTALQNRNFAMQSAQSFNPLQTGSNTTQTTGGVGSWLPQVAGAALGAATGGMGGGLLGGLMGGMGSAVSSLGAINSSGGGLAAQGGQTSGYNFSQNPNPLASSGGGSMPWLN